MAASYSSTGEEKSSMIIEGFICPECQQDMSSIDMLQAHFQLLHSKDRSQNHSNTHTMNRNNSTGKISSEYANNRRGISIVSKFNKFDKSKIFF